MKLELHGLIGNLKQPESFKGSGYTSRCFTTVLQNTQGLFHNKKGLTMILKSLESPGPQWRLLPIGFVISGLTGVRTEVGINERYWLWDPACRN